MKCYPERRFSCELVMKDSSNRIVVLVLLGWLCFAVGLGGWFHDATAPAVAATAWTLTAFVLLACWKITPIRASVLNIDLRWLVLFHVIRLFAGACFLLLCQRSQITVRVRKNGRLGRYHRCCNGAGGSHRDAHSIREVALAYLEHDRTYRHHFCCLERAPVWLKRLAVDARVAGTSAQSSPDVSGAAHYRVARFDFCSAGASRSSPNQPLIATN